MELELKHLAPYLPYGLKVMLSGARELTMTANKQPSVTEVNIMDVVRLDSYKPLLIPLDDIPNFVVDNCGYKNRQELIIETISGNISSNNLYHFIKEHYDIFGLIGAGLALNKKENKKTTI